MKKFLVTGGAGFIGSNLVMSLQAKYPDAWICVVDDLKGGDFRNLEGFKGNFINLGLHGKEWFGQLANVEFDGVFHLGAYSDTRETNIWEMIHCNIEGFRAALATSRKNKCPFIYASSAAVYGKTNQPSKESDPLRPANIYGFGKVMIDNIASSVIENVRGQTIVGLRFFNVYGKNEHHKRGHNSMIYQLWHQRRNRGEFTLFHDGEQKRDFVHVDDVVNCMVAAYEGRKSGIFNCGSGVAISFNQLCQWISPDFPVNYSEAAPEYFQPFTQADLTLVKKELNWMPLVSPENGIKKYVNWLDKNTGNQ